MKTFRSSLLITLLVLASFVNGMAQKWDLSKAVILSATTASSPVRQTAITVLQEEVTKRSSLHLSTGQTWGKSTIIALATSNEKELEGVAVPHRQGEQYPESKPEGYRITTSTAGDKKVLWIIGADERGILFGIGKLLRSASIEPGRFWLPQPLEVASSPLQPIRGHQLGYRNTANSYDAWSVAQYEQYIRDLIIFGTNAIECIPTNDTDHSVHMQIPPQQMNMEVSRLCAKYGISYWIWAPVTFDLNDQGKRKAELDTQEAFFEHCPQLNEVFVPGGDPGDNHPREVLPYLKDLHDRLAKYHPQAGIWLSLQGFNAEKIDYFFAFLEKYHPTWLRGVVYGPGSPSLADTRFRLPKQYMLRHYPDITHNVRCDYPVTNWDQAFMLTIGREGINPMPNYYDKIHGQYAQFTDGFVSYSDGCHDDVNKVTWSMRGWDIDQEPTQIMTDYCRFFFGHKLAEAGASGILALESNWVGPIKQNGGIETTLAYWKNLEHENPQLAGNWRWQMLVLRAYYDTYQRHRKFYEQGLEKAANQILATAPTIGAEAAMTQALEMVNRADTHPVDQEMHHTIVAYCDKLFHSIGLQTDVDKYHAANSQRGCILQFVNFPLNNRWWLTDEFKKIRKMGSEQEKLDRLEVIRTWENPGPGSYYDNISNIETGPHVRTTSYDATDVAWWEGGKTRTRLSFQLFQIDPVLEYSDLDFNARYVIRVCGSGDALIRVDGERLEPILYNKGIGEFKEFVVPKWITQDGKMRITFDRPEESNIRWTKYSHISEVWVLKQPTNESN